MPAAKHWVTVRKTGTTDSSNDNWFVGASPYAVAGIWTGHQQPAQIHKEEQGAVHTLWRDIMAEWLKEKPSKTYNLGGNVEQHNYLKDSGLLTMYSGGDKILTGYYTSDNAPEYDTKDPYAKPKPETSTTESSGSEESSGTEESSEPEEESSEPVEESSEIEESSEEESSEPSEIVISESSQDEPVEESSEEPPPQESVEESTASETGG